MSTFTQLYTNKYIRVPKKELEPMPSLWRGCVGMAKKSRFGVHPQRSGCTCIWKTGYLGSDKFYFKLKIELKIYINLN